MKGIRKSLDFGCGFRVPVTFKPSIPGRDGEFDPNTNSIALNSSSPLWEQYDAYAHEVVHAAIDFCRHVQQQYVIPMRLEAERTKHALNEGEHD